uniref:Uncharacterized protein n=1 Tax=Anguilla anguilla TaxID=7936 RepID=A0A0E9RLE1_ANGAN
MLSWNKTISWLGISPFLCNYDTETIGTSEPNDTEFQSSGTKRCFIF